MAYMGETTHAQRPEIQGLANEKGYVNGCNTSFIHFYVHMFVYAGFLEG